MACAAITGLAARLPREAREVQHYARQTMPEAAGAALSACADPCSRPEPVLARIAPRSQELDPQRHWIVLDSVPNPPTHEIPLTMCAPRW
eukprot:2775309-Prymnesium_polylepis.1